MVITRTPLRVSLCGGGSDLPAFWHAEPGGPCDIGAVVGTTIDRYVYVSINQHFDNKVRVSYSRTELVERADDLKHELVRGCLSYFGIERGMEVTSVADVPGEGTGLGSSSAFTVGLINALHAWSGRRVCPERLAREAYHVEREICGKPIGRQDPWFAAYGGTMGMEFWPDDSVQVLPLTCLPERLAELERHLLLLYTGVSRSSSDILAAQGRQTECDPATREIVRQMTFQTRKVHDLLTVGKWRKLGELIHEGWVLKRRISAGITTPEIDAWYETARTYGAYGGKLLGAGGGGFLLLIVPPDKRAAVVEQLPSLRETPCRLEATGSTVIYSDREGGTCAACDD